MTDRDYRAILYDVTERIATITLNRPERLNTMTQRAWAEIADALERANADDDVRAIIVTGSGRAFCAGVDLEGGGGTFKHADWSRPEEFRDRGGRVALQIFDLDKPVIAALNGAAVGVGATVVLPMDVRIAAESARFGFPFARRGIAPEACSAWFLPRIVGISQALEWTYSGRLFSAEEALERGLVSKVVPDAELLSAAREVAHAFADDTSAVAVTLTRHLMWKMLGADHPIEAHKVDSPSLYWLGRGPDAQEGISAFLEKRRPRFTARPSTDMPPFFPWWSTRHFG